MAVQCVGFDLRADGRGQLIAVEFSRIPFSVQRVFQVSRAPMEQVRGGHAHRECHQLLLASVGSIEVTVHDGSVEGVVLLEAPDVGLHLPPGHWASERYLTDDALLTVFASHPYDPGDYIHDFDEFLADRSDSNGT